MARTVLVTGGGTGIGYAIAERFLGDGDTVYLTGRRVEVLEKSVATLGERAHAIACDHTDPEQISTLAARLPDRLDVLINNAGGQTGFDRPEPEDLTALAESWWSNLNANLLSAVLTTHALTDRLTEGATVIHLGSIAADNGSGSYGAAKAALSSWNIDLARTLGPRGITCNVVSPGYIADTEFFRDKLTPQRRETLISNTFTARPGAPEDIAATVHFLTTPGARHITAQTVNVNGGAHPTR
ncbi:SDR family NAD(P)-dependent oxidoreductase [Nocardia pseudobrasiliensis]|uniref:3-oxoacyl-[acyl-carrier protein] reductase n=1 Tax=Nocardia pseudobrasiliensis TaxID=45979 RepID=A0A370I825_9NOCA|nr:SDR family oxidoreductase [Nocardia pseudobrasiliensis]RDI66281.1 3-oxoacyl-[acyl-carrier protein] reductase [Nocardia pseudobrasiliensis]